MQSHWIEPIEITFLKYHWQIQVPGSRPYSVTTLTNSRVFQMATFIPSTLRRIILSSGEKVEYTDPTTIYEVLTWLIEQHNFTDVFPMFFGRLSGMALTVLVSHCPLPIQSRKQPSLSWRITWIFLLPWASPIQAGIEPVKWRMPMSNKQTSVSRWWNSHGALVDTSPILSFSRTALQSPMQLPT